MSWQDYVDKQLLASRCVSKAAIAGHDGNLWAKSDGFEVSTCYASPPARTCAYLPLASARCPSRHREKRSPRQASRELCSSLLRSEITKKRGPVPERRRQTLTSLSRPGGRTHHSFGNYLCVRDVLPRWCHVAAAPAAPRSRSFLRPFFSGGHPNAQHTHACAISIARGAIPVAGVAAPRARLVLGVRRFRVWLLLLRPSCTGE